MRTRTILAAAAVLVAACSSDPTSPDLGGSATVNLDVATAAADAVAEDVDVMAGMTGDVGYIGGGAALFDGPPDGPGNVNGCGFGGGRWSCPPNPANGLTVTRTIAFFDGTGAPQDQYDPLTTATIDIEATIEGDVTRGPWSSSIFRTRHLVFTGLEGENDTRTVNGEGEEEISRSGQPGNSPPRSYLLEGEFTIVDVVIPVPGDGVDPWPLSGTITRTWTVTRNGEDPVTKVVIVIFNGTSTPDATVNGEPFELDLTERMARRR